MSMSRHRWCMYIHGVAGKRKHGSGNKKPAALMYHHVDPCCQWLIYVYVAHPSNPCPQIFFSMVSSMFSLQGFSYEAVCFTSHFHPFSFLMDFFNVFTGWPIFWMSPIIPFLHLTSPHLAIQDVERQEEEKQEKAAAKSATAQPGWGEKHQTWGGVNTRW